MSRSMTVQQLSAWAATRRTPKISSSVTTAGVRPSAPARDSVGASAIDKHERLADVCPILNLSDKKLSDVRT